MRIFKDFTPSLTTKLLILVAVAYLFMSSSPPVKGEEAAPVFWEKGIDLAAKETVLENNTLRASGEVRFKSGEVEIRAGEVVLDLAKGLLTAPGRVTLKYGEETMTGESLAFFWREGRGSLGDLRLEAGKFYITAQRGSFDVYRKSATLENASFTQCELPRPDYRFLAKSLVVEEERLSARGVFLELFGLRLMPLLSFTVPLAPDRLRQVAEEHLPLPSLSQEDEGGVLAEVNQLYTLHKNTLGMATFGFSSQTGSRLGGRIFHLFGDEGLLEVEGNYRLAEQEGFLAVAASWPEEDGYLLRGELGVQGIKNEQGERFKGFFLPRLHVSIPSYRGGGLTFQPEGEAGWLRETPEAPGGPVVEGSFSQVRLKTGLDPINLGAVVLSAAGVVEADWYGGQGTTNDVGRRGILQTRVTLEQPLTPGLRWGVTYFWREIAGETPFASQRLLPRRNLDFVVMAGETAGKKLETILRYDLSGQRFSEVETFYYYPLNAEWSVSSEARYLLGDVGEAGRWSKLELATTRNLHCFKIKLSYEFVSRTAGLSFQQQL